MSWMECCWVAGCGVCGARMDDGSGLIMMGGLPGNKMTMMREG